VRLLVPAIHCLCHYGDGAAMHGILPLLWMMSFERWNKKCKNLTSNKTFPFRSLSKALVRDSAARYFRWRSQTPEVVPSMGLYGSCKHVDIGHDISSQILLTCGCQVHQTQVCDYKHAIIAGKHFGAGESLMLRRRCGSVVTAVVRGRSMYGLVKSFLRVHCPCHMCHDFVSLTWFPAPTYPDGDPLTVCIDITDIDINNLDTVDVIPMNTIQPSRIAVEIDYRYNKMFMMRMEGLDTLPVPYRRRIIIT